MFQRTANQNVPISPGNGVAPLGHHHRRQPAGLHAVQQHLPLHRLNRQRQALGGQPVPAPGTSTKHHGIATHHAAGDLHTGDPLCLCLQPQRGAVLTQHKTLKLQQSCAQGFHQAGVTHVRQVSLPQGPGKPRRQLRHLTIDKLLVYLLQRPVLLRCPLHRLGLLVHAQPQQPAGLYLGIDAGVREQVPRQGAVIVLRPARQRADGGTVAPGVERRHNPTARPGRLSPQLAALQQSYATTRLQ